MSTDPMQPIRQHNTHSPRGSALHRRQWLARSGAGIGGLAISCLLADEMQAAREIHDVGPHFAPKAKNVIFLFMYGGPSHIDLFDPKPELDRWHGKEIPVFRKEDAFMGKTQPFAMKSPFKFNRHGQSGIDVCDQFPHLSRCVDDLCVIRSMHCESNNHAPALFQMQSGSLLAGHPSMGSWATYGLGSQCRDLPGFVVMLDHQGAPVNGALNWSNGFMPASYQGVPLRHGRADRLPAAAGGNHARAPASGARPAETVEQ